MYYMGTTLLGMSEEEFWRCTARKLFALWEIHVRVNGLDQQEEKNRLPHPDILTNLFKEVMKWQGKSKLLT